MASSTLENLRETLLRGLRVELGPDQGFEAFERHLLLASRFHHAAKLNAPEQGERAAWRQYFGEHFPRGEEHALLLWESWRNTLLKEETPGSGVLISHGQPHGHWRVFDPGGLYVNLESMWDDFEESVDSMVALLAADPERRSRSIEWWASRQWSVQLFTLLPALMTTSASAASSATFARLRPPRA